MEELEKEKEKEREVEGSDKEDSVFEIEEAEVLVFFFSISQK